MTTWNVYLGDKLVATQLSLKDALAMIDGTRATTMIKSHLDL